MATPLRPFLISARPQPRGAQCPNCFTFNLLEHLPESKKQAAEAGWEVQCALCGSRFSLDDHGAAPATAA